MKREPNIECYECAEEGNRFMQHVSTRNVREVGSGMK